MIRPARDLAVEQPDVPAELPPVGATDTDLRDSIVLRRALRAGLGVFLALTLTTFIANTAFGGDGAAAVVWASASFTVGAIITSGWMVLALLADMAAGATPSRRRSLWTVALFALGFLSPILPAAALLAAAGP